MRDGTIELRQKGTSFRLIRELIATVGVAVGTAIMGSFLAELSHNSASLRQRQRFARGRTPVQNTIRVQPGAVSPTTVTMTGNSPLTPPPSSDSATTADVEKTSERSQPQRLRKRSGVKLAISYRAVGFDFDRVGKLASHRIVSFTITTRVRLPESPQDYIARRARNRRSTPAPHR
jgi:hypothetical protein